MGGKLGRKRMEEGKKKKGNWRKDLGQTKEVKRKPYGPHQGLRGKVGDTALNGSVRPAGAGHHGVALQG